MSETHERFKDVVREAMSVVSGGNGFGEEDVERYADDAYMAHCADPVLAALLALETTVREALRHWPAHEAVRLLHEGLESVERAREEG